MPNFSAKFHSAIKGADCSSSANLKAPEKTLHYNHSHDPYIMSVLFICIAYNHIANMRLTLSVERTRGTECKVKF
jgi:hypothetical protein